MDVEIAFERDIAADVGYAEVLAVVLAADGLMDVDIVVMQLCGGGQGTEKGKKCEGKVFLIGRVVWSCHIKYNRSRETT